MWGSIGLLYRPGVPRSSVGSQLRPTRPRIGPSPDVVRGETKGSLSRGWSWLSRPRRSHQRLGAWPCPHSRRLSGPRPTQGELEASLEAQNSSVGEQFPLSQGLDFVPVTQYALLPGMLSQHPDLSSPGPLGPRHPYCRPRRLPSPGFHRPHLSRWQNSRAGFPERRQPPKELLIPSIQF